MKLIIDGEFTITDETGTEVIATVGDLLYFSKGSTIRFFTPDYGISFFAVSGARMKLDKLRHVVDEGTL